MDSHMQRQRRLAPCVTRCNTGCLDLAPAQTLPEKKATDSELYVLHSGVDEEGKI